MVEVKVPQLSESVAEATLFQWKKHAGDAVALDEVLIEVETDKVVLEVPAPSAGTLAQIVKPDGSTVVSGELIATIDPQGKTAAAPASAASASALRASAAEPAAARGAGAAASGAALMQAAAPAQSVAP